MRKITLLICTALLSVLFANAQDLNVGLSSGIAFTDMKGAKAGLKSHQKSLLFETKVTDNFPAWFENKIEVNADFDRVIYGFYIVRNTTGGRISSQDFSANYFYNVSMRNVAFGINIKLLFKEVKKTRFFLSFGGGMENLRTDIKEELKLYSNNLTAINKDYGFYNNGIHGIMGFTAERKITNNISASAYLLHYFAPHYMKADIYIGNWKGFRTGLTFCLIVPEKIEKYSKADQ